MPPSDSTHAHLTALVAEAAGVPETAVVLSPRPALEHFANQLYDAWANGRHLIVKEFLRAPNQQADATREFGALTLLAPLDLAPQPLFHDPARGSIVIYEYMDGEMWDRRMPAPGELALLAECSLKIQAAEGLWPARGSERSLADVDSSMRANFQAYAAWAAAEFAPGQAAAEHCLAVLERRHNVIAALAAETPRLCFCRSDQRFANVIRRPSGQLGFVDWENSGLRDPARELADLLLHPNQEDLLSWEDWQAFLRPYLAEATQRDAGLWPRAHNYLALFPVYFLSILLARGLAFAQRGQLAGWAINGMPPNLRLRRYLARALAWPATDFARELAGLGDAAFFPVA